MGVESCPARGRIALAGLRSGGVGLRQHGDLHEVVREDAVPGPDPGTVDAVQAGAAVEHASEHPIAAAITTVAVHRTGEPATVTRFEALPGLGARGSVGDRAVLLGRARLLAKHGYAVPESLERYWRELEDRGVTVVLVGWDGAVQGLLAVADQVRASGGGAVAVLRPRRPASPSRRPPRSRG